MASPEIPGVPAKIPDRQQSPDKIPFSPEQALALVETQMAKLNRRYQDFKDLVEIAKERGIQVDYHQMEGLSKFVPLEQGETSFINLTSAIGGLTSDLFLQGVKVTPEELAEFRKRKGLK